MLMYLNYAMYDADIGVFKLLHAFSGQPHNYVIFII